MSNVIALTLPNRPHPLSRRWADLLPCFAEGRRARDDVFWLKENAELLNITECSGQGVDMSALEVYAGVYAEAAERLAFFPQYYRFHLSLALDLEDLGLQGDVGSAMCAWIAQQDLPAAEFNDLQRAEARRLLRRRGISADVDAGLDNRLQCFMARSETFAIPNKKATYELTHILFYLSEYGRKLPDISDAALRSLNFAGTLAWLDQNMDLLAEICVALRYAGTCPPKDWEAAVLSAVKQTSITPAQMASQDTYHTFFVGAWLARMTGADVVGQAVGAASRFDIPEPRGAIMRDLSESLMELRHDRPSDWSALRARLTRHVSEDQARVLQCAEETCEDFDRFFGIFARASRPMMASA